MNKILNQNQLDVLRDVIQEKVRVRCIPCVVSVEEVESRNGTKIKLSSTKFNTVPVLHSEIELQDFGSGISNNIENENLIDVYVNVHASYEGNGVELFNVSGSFRKSESSLKIMRPRFYEH